MPTRKQRILVLCTGNSCRSQMAAGWLTALLGDRIDAHSAGSQPAARVHPLAVQVMAEVGVDISAAAPKPMQSYLGQSFDKVITVCDDAAEVCPVFPGGGERLHWPFKDPAQAVGSDADVLAVFRRVRDEIRDQIVTHFKPT